MSSGAALLAAAQELHLDVVVASYDQGDRRMGEKLRRNVDRLLVVDTNDDEALTEAVLEVHAQRRILGIMPGFEFYVPVVAALAHRLGLPGLPVSDVDGVRDKATMHRLVREAGLRVPRAATAASGEQLDAAVAPVGFPCVLKPVDSAGSVHVSRADDLRQLHAAYRRMLTDERLDLGRRPDGRVLVEEYVDEEARPGEPVTVAGVRWQTWNDEGGDLALVRRTDDVTTLVVGHEVPEDELVEWAKEQMASYKYPRIVEFRDDLPMTATGKILKRELS